jgi:hypothetical protein
MKKIKAKSKTDLKINESPFAKYRGIGNEGIGSGRKVIQRWAKKMRGH